MDSKLQSIINAVLPTNVSADYVVRGGVHPVELFMLGKSRFAKRIGSVASILVPDNFTFLYADAKVNDTKIRVRTFPSTMTAGDYIRLGTSELRSVVDMVEDRELGARYLILDEGLSFSYEEGSVVYFHSTTVRVAGDLPNDSIDALTDPLIPRLVSTIYGFGPVLIEANYFLCNGDVLAFQNNADNPFSLKELDVAYVLEIQEGTLENPYITMVYFRQNVFYPASVFSDAAALRHRAYPAYVSNLIQLKYPFSGPLLLDWASDSVREGGRIEETMTAVLSHNATEVLNDVITKNTFLPARSVSFKSLVLWDRVAGTINLRASGLSALLDADGNFCITTQCVPRIPVGTSWKLEVFCIESVEVRIAYGNGVTPVPFTTVANKKNLVPVLVTDEEAKKIEISITGTPGIEAILGHMISNAVFPTELKYRIVAKSTEPSAWVCSALLIKPYFLSTEQLTVNLDSDSPDTPALL